MEHFLLLLAAVVLLKYRTFQRRVYTMACAVLLHPFFSLAFYHAQQPVLDSRSHSRLSSFVTLHLSLSHFSSSFSLFATQQEDRSVRMVGRSRTPPSMNDARVLQVFFLCFWNIHTSTLSKLPLLLRALSLRLLPFPRLRLCNLLYWLSSLCDLKLTLVVSLVSEADSVLWCLVASWTYLAYESW